MSDFVKLLNNCIEIFNLCKPKDSSTNNNSTKKPESDNLIEEMNDYFKLLLPIRPKFGDVIRIKAKLSPEPKEFIINLAVDSSLKDDVEPAMIAFHFKTTFTAHPSGNSGVYMSWKKGPGGFEEIIEDQNTWIDDDVEEIDIGIRFTRSDIHFLSGDSIEYKFKHKYEIHRIDRLFMSGDIDHIEEISLKYGN